MCGFSLFYLQFFSPFTLRLMNNQSCYFFPRTSINGLKMKWNKLDDMYENLQPSMALCLSVWAPWSAPFTNLLLWLCVPSSTSVISFFKRILSKKSFYTSIIAYKRGYNKTMYYFILLKWIELQKGKFLLGFI